MFAHVGTESWKPRGIDDLEPTAWEALRHSGSACVVAGPGAGKTEFLAQRAVYLLETGTCPDPYRILAISFKTDAAANLANRVRQRCVPELARRFSSLTFDAFTKGLVDRFRTVLPAPWRPSRRYALDFPKRRDVDAFLESARDAARHDWRHDVAALSPSNFEARHVGSFRLSTEPIEPQSATEFATRLWWEERYRNESESNLTFVTINRLAELVLRTNARLRRALCVTYPFVFVDEFQDTTYAQYDFLLSVFCAPRIITTAVGDDKQRIMLWAGARPDAFQRFQADFSARRFELLCNFRSSPELVRIQHVVARALDGSAPETVSRTTAEVSGAVAQVWRSRTEAAESEYLARWIASDMEERGTAPRDYALLVRQKAESFEDKLIEPMGQAGRSIRNESRTLGRTTLQDVLADDLAGAARAILRLAIQRRAPESWRLASEFVEQVRMVDPDDERACQRVEMELSAFIARLRDLVGEAQPESEVVQKVSAQLFGFLDLSAVRRAFPEYRTGEMTEIIPEAFELHLKACAETAPTWRDCLDLFEGLDSVPLMTVHKSKGLEYDTIIFVGLDDENWWSHTPGNPEGISTFFVALSRAKQRAVFTFCQERGRRRKVADLYQLLTDAGVPEIEI